MPNLPVHRNEQTGNPVLDRMQKNVRALIEYVRSLARDKPITMWLALDFTTTKATPQNTNLSFPVEDGDLWDVEMWTHTGVSGDALGMKYAISAPISSTCSGVLNTSLTSSTDITYQQILAVNTPIGPVHTVNGGLRFDSFNVRVKVVGSGRIALQACSTTAGSITTVGAKSCLRATRVTGEV